MSDREQFEQWAKQAPREWAVTLSGPKGAWPGQYVYHVQCAWEAWEQCNEDRADDLQHYFHDMEQLQETARLAERFVNAKGRYHSQIAMCDLMDHFGKPCVRPEK